LRCLCGSLRMSTLPLFPAARESDYDSFPRRLFSFRLEHNRRASLFFFFPALRICLMSFPLFNINFFLPLLSSSCVTARTCGWSSPLFSIYRFSLLGEEGDVLNSSLAIVLIPLSLSFFFPPTKNSSSLHPSERRRRFTFIFFFLGFFFFFDREVDALPMAIPPPFFFLSMRPSSLSYSRE